MHTPLFSVLVPAYNIESLIRQTLESALAQTIQDLEIVVVDDGSSDKTTEVVHSFTDPRIRLIHQANAGVSAARNRAIAEARGKYVAFLDGDDVWLPFHLETALRFFEAYPDIHWYSSAFEYHQGGYATNNKRHAAMGSMQLFHCAHAGLDGGLDFSYRHGTELHSRITVSSRHQKWRRRNGLGEICKHSIVFRQLFCRNGLLPTTPFFRFHRHYEQRPREIYGSF